jgi:hypothetical protein
MTDEKTCKPANPYDLSSIRRTSSDKSSTVSPMKQPYTLSSSQRPAKIGTVLRINKS